MLYYCGRIHKMRDVRGGDGGATMDHDEIERRRGITISSAATSIDWNNHRITLIDTPGHVDFTIEVERSLRVLDGAVLVLCAVGGVQSQSLTVNRQMRRYRVPRIAFINKMDRTGANPARVINQMRTRLNTNAIALQMPIGAGGSFDAVIDLLTMRYLTFENDDGSKVVAHDIPNDLVAPAHEAQQAMLEQLALLDDDLMQRLFDGTTISAEDLRRVIRRATIDHEMTAVLFGSAYRNVGVQCVLDAVNNFLPDPSERRIDATPIGEQYSASKRSIVQLSSDPRRPTVAMAFKTVVESFGLLTFLRVYQGQIERGQTLRNARTGKSVRIGRLVRIHAGSREEIDLAVAGEIVGVFAVDYYSGDTLSATALTLPWKTWWFPSL